MNMILNPTEMLQKHPTAKELLAQYNFTPMADQNLTEAEARAILSICGKQVKKQQKKPKTEQAAPWRRSPCHKAIAGRSRWR